MLHILQLVSALLGFLLFSISAAGQNLVPNGDFDEYDQCPRAENQFNGYVSNWSIPFGETSYFNICDYWNIINFPSRNNSPGNSMITTVRRNSTDNPRTYLRNKLVRPLQPAERVYISFWIYDWGGRYYYSEDYSIYFSDTLVTKQPEGGEKWIDLPAQFNWTGGIITDLAVFVPITGCYDAEGDEEFICLGNFKHPDSMRVDSAHYRATGNLLALDDVKIISEDDIEFSNITHYPGRIFIWDDPYDMNFRVRRLGTSSPFNSMIMPNEVVELEIFLPECGIVDTIELAPEPCEDCFALPSDIDICILDTISMDGLLVEGTEMVIGDRVYQRDEVFRPANDTTYAGIYRSAYCDTIALISVDIKACASCSPNFGNIALCPGARFDVSPYEPFEVRIEGVRVTKDTIISESGVYEIVLSSSRCDTVATFELIIDDCHYCLPGLELDKAEVCVNERLSLEPFLEDGMYIENELGRPCPGDYMLYVRHENCASWMDSIAVKVKVDRECYNYRLRDTICEGDRIMLEEDASLRLELGMKTRFFGGYDQALMLKDSYCPQVTIPKVVTVFECEECKYAIPNVFSPNSDGVNDIFSISVNCSVMEFEAEIYDRWGKLLYRSRDPHHIWNGRNASVGAYVYRIKMELFNGREVENIIEAGEISLVR